MSGYRFRVVLCAYERYIMPLYMYYRVVVDTLNDFFEFSKKKLWKRTGLAQGIRLLGWLGTKVSFVEIKGQSPK